MCIRDSLRIHRPVYQRPVYGLLYGIVRVAIGRPNVFRTLTRSRLDSLICALHFVFDFVGGKLIEVLVGIGMAAHQMPFVGRAFRNFGVLVHLSLIHIYYSITSPICTPFFCNFISPPAARTALMKSSGGGA